MSTEATTIPSRPAPIPLRQPPDRAGLGGLPVPVSTLVGRERDAAEVAALLRDPAVRLLTLTGPGGVGKTRLALQVATEVADDFADGVAFVELAAIRDPEFVAPAIAQELGLRPSGDQPADAAIENLLRTREALLVLDNFEQVVAAGPGLAALLRACPRLKALVTSRTLLHISGERAAPVQPLSLPRRNGNRERDAPLSVSSDRVVIDSESVRLFVERTREVRPGFVLTEENAADVAEICRRLDGLPLAIELAACRGQLFTPAALLARLELRLPQLTHGPRDLPARLQTMRDAIAWSYDLLTPEEQEVFRCLGAFRGGCTLEAAEAVCRVSGDADRADQHAAASQPSTTNPDPDITAVVESLTTQSLLRVALSLADDGAPRLTMLETVREFAAEQLAATDDDTPRRRHAGYFQALALQVEPTYWGDASGYPQYAIDPELGNLRAALDWAVEHGEADMALRLIGAMFDPHQMTGDNAREQWAWTRRALALPGGSPSTRVAALTNAAWAAQVRSSEFDARTLGEEALAVALQVGDEFGIATATAALGVVRLHAGDTAAARDFLSEALEGFRRLQTPGRIGWTLLNLAMVDSHDAVDEGGNPESLDRARTRYDEALAWFRATGHSLGVSRALHGLAYLTYKQRDLPRALASTQEVLALDWAQRWPVFSYLEDIADIAGRVGNAEAAARLYGAADAWREQFGLPIEPPFRAEYERDVAVARRALGDAAFAAAWAVGRSMEPEQSVNEALAFTLPAPAVPTLSLPPRSAEVLPLLAAGMSNAEIAEALYLSVRTIEHHVSRLFAILGVHSRSAAVEAAVAAGLLPAAAAAAASTPTPTTES